MSTLATPQRRPRISTRTASMRLIAVSLASAAAIFGGLAVQMANGHDPALGAGTSTAQSSGAGGSSSDNGFGTASGQSGLQDQSGGSTGGVVTRAS